jgi:hypothetical protein
MSDTGIGAVTGAAAGTHYHRRMRQDGAAEHSSSGLAHRHRPVTADSIATRMVLAAASGVSARIWSKRSRWRRKETTRFSPAQFVSFPRVLAGVATSFPSRRNGFSIFSSLYNKFTTTSAICLVSKIIKRDRNHHKFIIRTALIC